MVRRAATSAACAFSSVKAGGVGVAAPGSGVCARGIGVLIIVPAARNKHEPGKEGMSPRWNRTGNARTAKEQESAMPAAARGDWLCRRGKIARPAFPTAAASARIAGVWEASTRPGNLQRLPARIRQRLKGRGVGPRCHWRVSVHVVSPTTSCFCRQTEENLP